MYLPSSLPQSYYFYEVTPPTQSSPDYEEVDEYSLTDEAASVYDNISNSINYFGRDRMSSYRSESNRPVAAVKPFFYDASKRNSLQPIDYNDFQSSFPRSRKKPAPPPPHLPLKNPHFFQYPPLIKPRLTSNPNVQRSISISSGDYKTVVAPHGVTIGRRSYFPVYRNGASHLPPPDIPFVSAATLSRAAAGKLNLSTFLLASTPAEESVYSNRAPYSDVEKLLEAKKTNRSLETQHKSTHQPIKYRISSERQESCRRVVSIPQVKPKGTYMAQPVISGVETKPHSQKPVDNFVSTISVGDDSTSSSQKNSENVVKRPIKYATIRPRPSRPPPPPPYRIKNKPENIERNSEESPCGFAEEFFQTGISGPT